MMIWLIAAIAGVVVGASLVVLVRRTRSEASVSTSLAVNATGINKRGYDSGGVGSDGAGDGGDGD
jgi:hypothetical protein